MTKHTAWMIFSGKIPLAYTCRTLRKDCLNDFLDLCCGPSATKDTIREQGYTVHKITFTAAPAGQTESKATS